MLNSGSTAHFIALNSFMQVENQFLKWVLDWENRVFYSIWKEQQRYCFSVFYCQEMDNCVKNYHTYSRDELGQDRLAWTVFAKALLKEHSKVKHKGCSCSLKRYLCLSVWISFYLNLSSYSLVQRVLREILLCNQNLKFLFSFLPGMSMSLYISNFLEKKGPNFEHILCKEFFSLVSEKGSLNDQYLDFYRCAQPLIYYQIQNLSPLHGHISSYTSQCVAQKHRQSSTLIYLINKKILPHCKYNLLTLAIEFNDTALINTLLRNGASARIKIWDPVKEEYITPERMMISAINSIMASQQLLSKRENMSASVLDSIQRKKDAITAYAKKLKRSLLQPESQKASNVWDANKWKIELNKEIADEWGIGCTRPLPTLQHMAKICVRQQILEVDRDLLPCAVNKLPVPYLLKCYLNLELD